MWLGAVTRSCSLWIDTGGQEGGCTYSPADYQYCLAPALLPASRPGSFPLPCQFHIMLLSCLSLIQPELLGRPLMRGTSSHR